jgi:hypothetical protein
MKLHFLNMKPPPPTFVDMIGDVRSLDGSLVPHITRPSEVCDEQSFNSAAHHYIRAVPVDVRYLNIEVGLT